MTLLILYIIGAIAACTTTAAIDGYREEGWSDYHPGHFFVPLLIGLAWPATLPTVGAYQLGINMHKRSRANAERTRQLADEQRRRERELAQHMPEVDRALLAGKR